MASGAAEFVVDLNLGPDDVAYAMQIMGVRRAVAERNEAHRVGVARARRADPGRHRGAPARVRRVAAVRSARLGQGDHDLRHDRTPEGHHPSPRPPLVRACAAALASAVRAGRERPRAADDGVCAWRRAGDRRVARKRRLGRADRRRRCRLCGRPVRARRDHRRVRAADRAGEAGRGHAAHAHRRHQVHLLRHRDPAARALSRGRASCSGR